MSKSQAEVWLQKYEAAKGEEGKKTLRGEIEDPSEDQRNVEHITQNELGGYPFYGFQVFVFEEDRSVYVEQTHADADEAEWGRYGAATSGYTYASPAEFADVLTNAHSKVIKNIRALGATKVGEAALDNSPIPKSSRA